MQDADAIIHHPSAFNASQCHSVDSGPARHLEKGVLDHHSSLVVCLKQSPAPWSSMVSPIAWSQTIGRSGRQTAEGLVPPASRLERAFPVNFNSSNLINSSMDSCFKGTLELLTIGHAITGD